MRGGGRSAWWAPLIGQEGPICRSTPEKALSIRQGCMTFLGSQWPGGSGRPACTAGIPNPPEPGHHRVRHCCLLDHLVSRRAGLGHRRAGPGPPRRRRLGTGLTKTGVRATAHLPPAHDEPGRRGGNTCLSRRTPRRQPQKKRWPEPVAISGLAAATAPLPPCTSRNSPRLPHLRHVPAHRAPFVRWQPPCRVQS